jgi:hypothetical protein
MFRWFIAVLLACVYQPFPGVGQERPAVPKAGVTSDPVYLEKLHQLEAELADRETQNAVLIERVRELQLELEQVNSSASAAGIRRAKLDLEESLADLERRLGAGALPK